MPRRGLDDRQGGKAGGAPAAPVPLETAQLTGHPFLILPASRHRVALLASLFPHVEPPQRQQIRCVRHREKPAVMARQPLAVLPLHWPTIATLPADRQDSGGSAGAAAAQSAKDSQPLTCSSSIRTLEIFV
jgi:hypothetical protein